jgi:chromosome segregation ATPase
MRHDARLGVCLLVAAWCCQAGAQTRIYSCVDAKGRRLTSDRPIMDCLDREQQQYGENGMARGKLPPSLTAEERAVQDAKIHQEELALQRHAELKRRDRVLLNRYPNLASHERERESSLAQVDDAIATGEKRVADLEKQRAELAQQSQVVTKDVGKANRLKRAVDENAEHLSAQNRLLASQREERQRITARFDSERERLQGMWAQLQTPATTKQREVPVAATAAVTAKPAASSAH